MSKSYTFYIDLLYPKLHPFIDLNLYPGTHGLPRWEHEWRDWSFSGDPQIQKNCPALFWGQKLGFITIAMYIFI